MDIEPSGFGVVRVLITMITDIEVPDDLIPADIELVGICNNTASIMSAVSEGLKKAGNSREVIDSYRAVGDVRRL